MPVQQVMGPTLVRLPGPTLIQLVMGPTLVQLPGPTLVQWAPLWSYWSWAPPVEFAVLEGHDGGGPGLSQNAAEGSEAVAVGKNARRPEKGRM